MSETEVAQRFDEQKQDHDDVYLLISDEWSILPNYRCRQCGDNARKHPRINSIWGCLTCGFTTASVATYFREAQ